MMNFTDRSVAFLRGCSRFIRAVESLLVDLIASVAPWIAPLIPAFMTFSSAQTRLEFPVWVSFAAAIVVESLGLAAIYTTFQFFDWNDEKRKSDQKAPVMVAIPTAIFYLIVVLTINVILDKSEVTVKVAKGLLTSLSIISAIILAIRSQHSRRTEDVVEDKRLAHEERLRLKGQLPTLQVPQQLQVPQYIQHWDWRSLTDEEKRSNNGKPYQQIMAEHPGLSERAARYWVSRAGEIKTNGNSHV